MAGANYMGGKRHAAKARSRDTTSRAQKGFFGRQRFNLLVKGLATSSRDLAPKSVHSESATLSSVIDLAHARRHSETTEAPPRSFMPEIISVPPYTPKRIAERLCQSGSSSAATSSRSHSSKVLDALDMSEPLFIRAEMDRILAIPDLAGLSKRRQSPSLGSSPNRSKRQKLSSQDSRFPSGPSAGQRGPPRFPDEFNIPKYISPIFPDPETASQLVPDQGSPLLVTVSAMEKYSNRHDTIEMKGVQQYIEDEDFEPIDFDDSSFYDGCSHSELEAGFALSSPRRSVSNAYAYSASGSNFSLGPFHHDRSQNLSFDMDSSLPSSSVSSHIVLAPSQHSSPSSLGLWLPVPEPCAPIPPLLRSVSNYKPPFGTSQSSPSLHRRVSFPKSQPAKVTPLVPSPPPPLVRYGVSPPSNQVSVLRSQVGGSRPARDLESSCGVDLPLPVPVNQQFKGTLFDHDDPWRAIGRLLGFEEKQRATSNTNPVKDLIINDRKGVGYVGAQADQCQKILGHVDETDEEPLETVERSEIIDELPLPMAHQPDARPDPNVFHNHSLSCSDDPLEPTVNLMSTDPPPSNPRHSNEPPRHSEHSISMLDFMTHTTNSSGMILGPCLFSDGPGESDDED